MKKVTSPRLRGWLVASVTLFVVIGWTSSAQIPVVIYKLSQVSLSAVLGYWIDRSLFHWARP
ncbi:putative holin, partial [Escherichia coli]|nr:putative holin [Escherichia coli]